jgi:hypothetical protein
MEKIEKQVYSLQDRVDKLCAVCGEERGHVVASINKRGQISRVTCTKCGASSTFNSSKSTERRSPAQPCSPYDQTRTYRPGQTLMHPIYGQGEVTSVIEPQKIDVLFADRMRRLIHSRA